MYLPIQHYVGVLIKVEECDNPQVQNAQKTRIDITLDYSKLVL